MGKKKNSNTENIETKIENTSVEEVGVCEEVKTEEPDKDITVEAPVVDDTKIEEDSKEEPSKEQEASTVNKEEEVVKEEPNEVEAPSNEEEVKAEIMSGYFVQLNKEAFTDEKLKVVEERLNKYALQYSVSAEGLVFVGPYLTKDGAINGRRMVIRCGLKGDIVEPKN